MVDTNKSGLTQYCHVQLVPTIPTVHFLPHVCMTDDCLLTNIPHIATLEVSDLLKKLPLKCNIEGVL